MSKRWDKMLREYSGRLVSLNKPDLPTLLGHLFTMSVGGPAIVASLPTFTPPAYKQLSARMAALGDNWDWVTMMSNRNGQPNDTIEYMIFCPAEDTEYLSQMMGHYMTEELGGVLVTPLTQVPDKLN